MYGVANLDKYDHFTFPGAVPRTFIGSTLLARISIPVIQVANSFGFVASKFNLQIISSPPSIINAQSCWNLSHQTSGLASLWASHWITIHSHHHITISQFHVPFWMGRTLPNMFAMIPVNISSALLFSRPPSTPKPSSANVYAAIALLTFSAVVFRAQSGPGTGLSSIALTTAVDSYFWKTAVWPEFSGIYFNIVEGKGSEWGTSPPWTYFVSFLLKFLLTTFPLSILGFVMDKHIQEALLPHIAFIGIISLLAHKEWRFIVYVIPVFNIAAARAGRWMRAFFSSISAIDSRSLQGVPTKSSLIGHLLFLGFRSSLLLNLAGMAMLTMSSMANYPSYSSGEALKRFNDAYPPPVPNGKAYHVHISNLAAQTGTSLFLQVHAPPFPSTSLFSSANVSDHVHISNFAAQTGASLFLQIHVPLFDLHTSSAVEPK
ncbi:glycosyltransferase family 22 protein [Collybiopsis luxurians FD-317 M1]|uniref:Mannosyltransferase n=1 Tax=Collybiopsis luxurians FD-317 M1 TaxID=944289 RepID=A0A0D0CQH1_9AGAR|nr:glycosyltransferase family 22 protein [Collybiopsis luxurians FD-317 M1]